MENYNCEPDEIVTNKDRARTSLYVLCMMYLNLVAQPREKRALRGPAGFLKALSTDLIAQKYANLLLWHIHGYSPAVLFRSLGNLSTRFFLEQFINRIMWRKPLEDGEPPVEFLYTGPADITRIPRALCGFNLKMRMIMKFAIREQQQTSTLLAHEINEKYLKQEFKTGQEDGMKWAYNTSILPLFDAAFRMTAEDADTVGKASEAIFPPVPVGGSSDSDQLEGFSLNSHDNSLSLNDGECQSFKVEPTPSDNVTDVISNKFYSSKIYCIPDFSLTTHTCSPNILLRTYEQGWTMAVREYLYERKEKILPDLLSKV